MSRSKFLSDLLEQEMDRKEFLARLGAGVLTIIGITGLIRSLSGTHRSSGYGSTSYGGSRQVGSTFTSRKG